MMIEKHLRVMRVVRQAKHNVFAQRTTPGDDITLLQRVRLLIFYLLLSTSVGVKVGPTHCSACIYLCVWLCAAYISFCNFRGSSSFYRRCV